MPAKSPIDISDPTLRFSIEVNGSQMKDSYPVLSMNIFHEINKISYAEIILTDGYPASDNFEISNSNDFIPGSTVDISAGYGYESLTKIFSGIVVSQALELQSNGLPKLIVSCKNKAVCMTYNRKEEMFKDKPDSSIISSIFSQYGLPCTVDTTSVKNELVFQKLATDWDFILARSEFCGFVVISDNEKIKIGKPDLSSQAVLKVVLGDSILSFQAELSGEAQPTSIEATGWDIKNQALLKATAKEPKLNSQGNLGAKTLSGKLSNSKLSLSSITPTPNDGLQSWADSTLLKLRLNALKGHVSFIGNGSVMPGSIIELGGVGNRFNGDAYVSALTHEIKDGGWTTTVKFGLENKPVFEQSNFSYPPANGQLPAINGLQLGTVKNIFEDPDSQFRILVDIPSNATNQSGIWARLSNFYATSGAGAFFIPEIGDEVVVGFLENDPRYPIILGSLYSSAKKPETIVKDNNNYIKTLSSKSKILISFDDEKKIIKITTPGGNSVTLNDEAKSIVLQDQNNNKIKMGLDGITISSDKDINISATGKLSIKATSGLKLSSDQDIQLSGLNINNSANAGFTAKGNAQAELSSSGSTTVKGSIVMIN